jgi:hypothetical protein
MNRICSIATGARAASGRTLQVFQVLEDVATEKGPHLVGSVPLQL